MRSCLSRITGHLHQGQYYQALREPELEEKRKGRKRIYDKEKSNICLTCKKILCDGNCEEVRRKEPND